MKAVVLMMAVAAARSACAARRIAPAEDLSPRVPDGVTPLTTEQDRTLSE